MSYMKKMLAVVLILVMTFGLVLEAGAAGSPTVGPQYDPSTDIVTEETEGTVIKAKVKKKTIVSIQGEGAKSVTVKTLVGPDGTEFQITTIGDGKKGVFATAKGRRVTKLTTPEGVTFSKYAFKGSKVKTIVAGGSVTFKKGTFKGTKQKTVTIKLSAKKAKQIKVSKGAFEGLSSKSKIIVSKKTMTKKQFEALKAKLKAAGFPGTIVRK